MSTTTNYATMPTSMLRAIATSLYTPEYRQSFMLFTEPPLGVTSHLENAPNSRGICYIAIGVILLVISTTVVAMRFYARTVLSRALGWDDYTCAAALVLTYIWTGATINSALIGLGIEGWNLRVRVADVEEYNLMNWMSASAYIAAVALVKVSLLILYLRTFTAKGAFRITLWIVMIAIILSHAQVLIVYWAKVGPYDCIWKYATLPTELWNTFCHKRYNNLPNWVFVSILTVFLDVIVLALPIRAVWKLHMEKRQKIAVVMLCGAGAIVTIIGLIRFVWIYEWFIETHVTYYSTTFLDFRVNLCSTLELNTAIICTSLPPLKTFVRHFGLRFFETVRSGKFASSGNNTHNSKRAVAHPSTLHPSRASRKRPGQTDEESEIDGSYLELVDGKTDQSYNMTTKLVDSQPSSIAGRSHERSLE